MLLARQIYMVSCACNWMWQVAGVFACLSTGYVTIWHLLTLPYVGTYRLGFLARPLTNQGGTYRLGFLVRPLTNQGGTYRLGFLVRPLTNHGGTYRLGFLVRPLTNQGGAGWQISLLTIP